MSRQPKCKKCHNVIGVEQKRRNLCVDCERKAMGLTPAPEPKPYNPDEDFRFEWEGTSC